jgi:hypothetical protein
MTGIVIRDDSDRTFLHRMIDTVKVGTEVTMGPERRTLPQNNKMWAMPTDVAMHKGTRWPFLRGGPVEAALHACLRPGG